MTSATPPVAITELLPRYPIRPPAEPLQNRAVGLIKGRYLPSAESEYQGLLLADDGVLIDTVVLGKVKSLLNKVDPETSHIWVVYPKTNTNPKKQQDPEKPTLPPLHVQIAGIWEPETLHPSTPEEAVPEGLEANPNYFSVRGAVAFQNKEEGWLMVKVMQKPKEPGGKPFFNKIRVEGSVAEKAVNAFWEFDCTRSGQQLTIVEARLIKKFKPKSPSGKPKGKFTKGGKPVKPGEKPLQGTQDKPKPRPNPKPKQ